MIESSYFRRRKLETRGCHLEKWVNPRSVLYALFSSNLSAAQVVGDTTLILTSMLATDTFLAPPLTRED